MITPNKLKKILPINKITKNFILKSRETIINIINGKDPRLLIICGPCSIHEIKSAIDYGTRLKFLSKKFINKLYIVMRVYLEKSRTIYGWKGLINDPYINQSFDIESGLFIARNLLLHLLKLELPIATEILSINNYQYINDLISWGSVGARTVESQIHREMVSGISIPVGFKNNTDGNITKAINAIMASRLKHSFININQHGKINIVNTNGNCNSHIILRGGKTPNYYNDNIYFCKRKMTNLGLPTALLIDCSHGNANNNYLNQLKVARFILKQINNNNNHDIIGIMLESNINSGNQKLNSSKHLKYGVSITDPCINWDTTNEILFEIYNNLSTRIIK
ncbi:MAG: 3-deoxy-7-phosphoheptulonate synthase [Candidatus Lightella neohaematopini]|nr:3-deoxy-7-phosphoheptulonate synthase [Candidatus Lightella neohaematopini]MCV2528649.1 3-deoxy-7-phosphoheptulonate synthase [Candidatus Lightella neohaematopini]